MSDINTYTTLITSQELIPVGSPAEIAVYKTVNFRRGKVNGKRHVDITFLDEQGNMGWVARVNETAFVAIAAAFNAPDKKGLQTFLDTIRRRRGKA